MGRAGQSKRRVKLDEDSELKVERKKRRTGNDTVEWSREKGES